MTAARPVPLVLGLGWAGAPVGGLDRYVHDLLEAWPEARAVVVGPADDPRVTGVADHQRPLLARVRGIARAAGSQRAAVDLVDAHFALYALLPVLGTLRHLPLMVHFHGPWAAEASAAGDRSRIARAGRAAIERAVYRRAAVVVTLSGAFARVAIEEYGVSPWRVRIVPPGVDTTRFTPGDRVAARQQLGIPADAWTVATARRLTPRTGVADLLEAWRLLLHDPPEGGETVLVVAGDGELRPELEAQADALGATVRFTGHVADDDLPLVYRAADVFVMPSRELEGFGLAVLEAMACGTPVIVTDAGGLPEAAGPLGTVVSASAPAELAAALRVARAGAVPTRQACTAYGASFTLVRLGAAHRALAEAITLPAVDPPLRVVHVDHCAQLSGAELAMACLVRAVPDVTHHVVLFEAGPLTAELARGRTTVEVLAMGETGRALPRALVAHGLPLRALVEATTQTLRLARRLGALQPDVVHAHSLKSALIASAAGRIARVPVIWHARDRVDDDSMPASAVRGVRWLARRLPTTVVANSRTTLDSLALPMGGPDGVVLPDPIDPGPNTGSDEKPRADGRLRVAMVGRLAPWKGQHVFLQAFARAFPDGGACGIVAGKAMFGEDEYARALPAIAAAFGATNVRFAGFVRDVPALLADVDVLVHASVSPEPFGQVVVEGMAAGLPVIATGAGGPAEIVHDGVDGLLVPAGDVAALTDALRNLAHDPPLRARLGRAARARAADFAPERVGPRMERIYRTALAKHE